MQGAMLAVIATLCGIGQVAPGPVVPLGLDDHWHQDATGAWRIRTDHRNLLAMRHPPAPRENGAHAMAWRMVTPPALWQEPVRLVFYCSDNVDAGAELEGAFAGRRFKQVLIDNKVVWHRDVCAAGPPETASPFEVPLDVEPGKRFRLTLLAYDAEEKGGPAGDGAGAFMTHVYWGDVALVHGDTTPPLGKRPSETKVQSVHAARWPLSSPGAGWPESRAHFALDTAGRDLPATGFPVSMGIPFPEGKLDDLDEVRLQNAREQAVYSHKTVLARWPDDSLRWVRFGFLARPGMESVDLVFQNDHAKAPRGLETTESEDAVRVTSHPLSFTMRHGDPVTDIKQRDTLRVASAQLELETAGERIFGAAGQVRAEQNPFCTTVTAEGAFEGVSGSGGSFVLACTAYAELPFMRWRVRWYNDTAEPVAVSGLRLTLSLPEPPETVTLAGNETAPPAVFRQPAATKATLNGNPVQPESHNAYCAWEGGLLAVRRFAQLAPKAIEIRDTKVIVDLAAGGVQPVYFTPGEAKTHELWLALGKVDPAPFLAAIETPPILKNPAYFCASGAFGAAHPAPDGLAQRLAERYAEKTWRELGCHSGVRHFPGAPYLGGVPNWCNNYGERMLGCWSAWLVTGDRAWFDRALDVCAHLSDVAVIHTEVPGHAWLGGMHGPGKNHVPGPWLPTLRSDGLAVFDRLRGGIESREAFLGAAEYLLKTGMPGPAATPRDFAAPLDTLCTAYADTWDMRFLEAGTRWVDGVWKHLERRRGTWPCRHGSHLYRGNVPWMAAQLARPLYRWYRLTGDMEAAQALTALAESVVCENTDWDAPGAVEGYSHNPEFPRTAAYDLLITPMVFAAYELTEDPFFLQAAMAQWRRWNKTDTPPDVFNTFWNTPWLAWYLHKYQVIEPETEPETTAH